MNMPLIPNFYRFMTIGLLLCMISACNTNTDIIFQEQDKESDFVKKHAVTRTAIAIDDLFDSLNQVCGLKTRMEHPSASGPELVQYISQIPVNITDSLYAVYCTPQSIQTYEEIEQYTYNALIQNSSEEQVNKLFDFIADYTDNGGKNTQLLDEAMEDVSPMIQSCMIKSAAIIDAVIEEFALERASNSTCIEELKVALAGSLITGEIQEAILEELAVYPDVDVCAALVMAGYDLFSAIKVAYDYHLCCAKKWN